MRSVHSPNAIEHVVTPIYGGRGLWSGWLVTTRSKGGRTALHNKNQRVSFVHVSISECPASRKARALTAAKLLIEAAWRCAGPMAFYGYFSSKQDLLIALLGDFHQGHFGFRLLALT